MALPKKNSRKINIDGIQYSWIASGNDDYIELVICSSTGDGQKLLAQFDYHPIYIDKEETILEQQFIITPIVVRQVIEYGLTSGWSPEKRGVELRLGYLNNMVHYKLSEKIKTK
jgi:hypothetical protein